MATPANIRDTMAGSENITSRQINKGLSLRMHNGGVPAKIDAQALHCVNQWLHATSSKPIIWQGLQFVDL